MAAKTIVFTTTVFFVLFLLLLVASSATNAVVVPQTSSSLLTHAQHSYVADKSSYVSISSQFTGVVSSQSSLLISGFNIDHLDLSLLFYPGATVVIKDSIFRKGLLMRKQPDAGGLQSCTTIATSPPPLPGLTPAPSTILPADLLTQYDPRAVTIVIEECQFGPEMQADFAVRLDMTWTCPDRANHRNNPLTDSVQIFFRRNTVIFAPPPTAPPKSTTVAGMFMWPARSSEYDTIRPSTLNTMNRTLLLRPSLFVVFNNDFILNGSAINLQGSVPPTVIDIGDNDLNDASDVALPMLHPTLGCNLTISRNTLNKPAKLAAEFANLAAAISSKFGFHRSLRPILIQPFANSSVQAPTAAFSTALLTTVKPVLNVEISDNDFFLRGLDSGLDLQPIADLYVARFMGVKNDNNSPLGRTVFHRNRFEMTGDFRAAAAVSALVLTYCVLSSSTTSSVAALLNISKNTIIIGNTEQPWQHVLVFLLSSLRLQQQQQQSSMMTMARSFVFDSNSLTFTRSGSSRVIMLYVARDSEFVGSGVTLTNNVFECHSAMEMVMLWFSVFTAGEQDVGQHIRLVGSAQQQQQQQQTIAALLTVTGNRMNTTVNSTYAARVHVDFASVAVDSIFLRMVRVKFQLTSSAGPQQQQQQQQTLLQVTDNSATMRVIAQEHYDTQEPTVTNPFVFLSFTGNNADSGFSSEAVFLSSGRPMTIKTAITISNNQFYAVDSPQSYFVMFCRSDVARSTVYDTNLAWIPTLLLPSVLTISNNVFLFENIDFVTTSTPDRRGHMNLRAELNVMLVYLGELLGTQNNNNNNAVNTSIVIQHNTFVCNATGARCYYVMLRRSARIGQFTISDGYFRQTSHGTVVVVSLSFNDEIWRFLFERVVAIMHASRFDVIEPGAYGELETIGDNRIVCRYGTIMFRDIYIQLKRRPEFDDSIGQSRSDIFRFSGFQIKSILLENVSVILPSTAQEIPGPENNRDVYFFKVYFFSSLGCPNVRIVRCVFDVRVVVAGVFIMEDVYVGLYEDAVQHAGGTRATNMVLTQTFDVEDCVIRIFAPSDDEVRPGALPPTSTTLYFILSSFVSKPGGGGGPPDLGTMRPLTRYYNIKGSTSIFLGGPGADLACVFSFTSMLVHGEIMISGPVTMNAKSYFQFSVSSRLDLVNLSDSECFIYNGNKVTARNARRILAPPSLPPLDEVRAALDGQFEQPGAADFMIFAYQSGTMKPLIVDKIALSRHSRCLASYTHSKSPYPTRSQRLTDTDNVTITRPPTRTATASFTQRQLPRVESAQLPAATQTTSSVIASLTSVASSFAASPASALDAGRALSTLATLSRCRAWGKATAELAQQSSSTTHTDLKRNEAQMKRKFISDYLGRSPLPFPESWIPNLCFGAKHGQCLRGAIVAGALFAFVGAVCCATLLGIALSVKAVKAQIREEEELEEAVEMARRQRRHRQQRSGRSSRDENNNNNSDDDSSSRSTNNKKSVMSKISLKYDVLRRGRFPFIIGQALIIQLAYISSHSWALLLNPTSTATGSDKFFFGVLPLLLMFALTVGFYVYVAFNALQQQQVQHQEQQRNVSSSSCFPSSLPRENICQVERARQWFPQKINSELGDGVLTTPAWKLRVINMTHFITSSKWLRGAFFGDFCWSQGTTRNSVINGNDVCFLRQISGLVNKCHGPLCQQALREYWKAVDGEGGDTSGMLMMSLSSGGGGDSQRRHRSQNNNNKMNHRMNFTVASAVSQHPQQQTRQPWRNRISPFAVGISIVLLMATTLAQTVAALSPDTACETSLIAMAVINFIAAVVSVFLRPQLIPIRNLASALGDVSSLIGAALGAAAAATSREQQEESASSLATAATAFVSISLATGMLTTVLGVVGKALITLQYVRLCTPAEYRDLQVEVRQREAEAEEMTNMDTWRNHSRSHNGERNNETTRRHRSSSSSSHYHAADSSGERRRGGGSRRRPTNVQDLMRRGGGGGGGGGGGDASLF